MLLETASVGPWGTNCYVVADGPKSECLIIDPGLDAIPFVTQTIADFGLRPVAILTTHGHLDHIWNLQPLAQDLDIPAVIHKSDRQFFTDPLKGISPEAIAVVNNLTPNQKWLEPQEVIEVSGRTNLNFAGFDIAIIPTPGHTAGSVCFKINNNKLFTGDLLFKNAVGRTDLFSGDSDEMTKSLKLVLSEFDDSTELLPGHGPRTDLGTERINNPFLLKLLQS